MKLWIIFILAATMSVRALYVPLTPVKILLGVIGLRVRLHLAAAHEGGRAAPVAVSIGLTSRATLESG